MILSIIIALFLLLILSLLLTPMTLCIDTASNQYGLKLQGFTEVNLEKHEAEIFRIRLKVLFLNFYTYPLKKRRLKKKGHSKNKKDHGKRRNLLKSKKQIPVKKIFRIMKTFKVKQCLIDVDTGDCILNAKLYPLFALLNYNGVDCYINFQGRNRLVLLANSRPIDIIKSFINY